MVDVFCSIIHNNISFAVLFYNCFGLFYAYIVHPKSNLSCSIHSTDVCFSDKLDRWFHTPLEDVVLYFTSLPTTISYLIAIKLGFKCAYSEN